jgi:RNA recognition motif-containing protein
MNIFVSGLNYSLTSDELQAIFTQYGEVASAKVITDRDTGRSRGFGFVEMSDDAEARNAIDALDQARSTLKKLKTVHVPLTVEKVDSVKDIDSIRF